MHLQHITSKKRTGTRETKVPHHRHYRIVTTLLHTTVNLHHINFGAIQISTSTTSPSPAKPSVTADIHFDRRDASVQKTLGLAQSHHNAILNNPLRRCGTCFSCNRRHCHSDHYHYLHLNLHPDPHTRLHHSDPDLRRRRANRHPLHRDHLLMLNALFIHSSLSISRQRQLHHRLFIRNRRTLPFQLWLRRQPQLLWRTNRPSEAFPWCCLTEY